MKRHNRSALSQLANRIENGSVEAIVVNDQEVKLVIYEDTAPLITRREADIPLTQTLIGLGVSPEKLAKVKIQYEAPGNSGNWLSLFVNLLPLIFIGGLFFILFRQTQGSNNQALSFGKSKARVLYG